MKFATKTVLMFFALSVTSLLSGCATIFTSNNIKFPVLTTPEGATATAYTKAHINKKYKDVVCVTPCKMKLRQTRNYTITIKKEGYNTKIFNIKSYNSVESDSASFGENLGTAVLFGGPIGLISMGVDASSGADDRLFPGYINTQLVPNNKSVKVNIDKTVQKTKNKIKTTMTEKKIAVSILKRNTVPSEN